MLARKLRRCARVNPSVSDYLTVTYAGSLVEGSTTARTTSTYASAPIGPASGDRYVLVVATSFDIYLTAPVISNISVGGVNVTTLDWYKQGGYGSPVDGIGLAFGILKVATGTTANVVVTFASNISNKVIIGVYYINASRAFNATRSNFSNNSSASTNYTVTQTHAGIAAFVAAWLRINSTAPTISGGFTTNVGPVDVRTNELAALFSVNKTTGATTGVSVTSSSADAGGLLSQMMFQLT